MVVKLDVYIEEYDKDFSILIGKNQNENDMLIKKSDPNDIWFHLENISGPHIILVTENKKIPKRILNYIGTLFREHKNNLQSNFSVIYTLIQHVKLTKIPGTVIPVNTKRIKY